MYTSIRLEEEPLLLGRTKTSRWSRVGMFMFVFLLVGALGSALIYTRQSRSMEGEVGLPSADNKFSKYGKAVLQALSSTKLKPWKGKTWFSYPTGSFLDGPYSNWFFFTPTLVQFGKSTETLPVLADQCNDGTKEYCECVTDDDCKKLLKDDVASYKPNKKFKYKKQPNPTSKCLPSIEFGTKDLPKKICQAHSFGFVDKIYETIASADKFVDFSSLMLPTPMKSLNNFDKRFGTFDGLFMTALQNAVKDLDKKAKTKGADGSIQPIHLRFLIGIGEMHGRFLVTTVNAYGEMFLNRLVDKIQDKTASQLTIDFTMNEISSLASGQLLPVWNHAKIICVDGIRMITGGHNLWGTDYLNHAPSSDVSFVVSGTVAQSGHEWLNEQWKEAFKHTIWGDKALRWSKGNITPLREYEAPTFTYKKLKPGDATPKAVSVPMIALGRNGGRFAKHDSYQQSGDHAITALFRSATASIKLDLQKITVNGWWVPYIRDEIIAAIHSKTNNDYVYVDLIYSGLEALTATGKGKYPKDGDYDNDSTPTDLQLEVVKEVVSSSGMKWKCNKQPFWDALLLNKAGAKYNAFQDLVHRVCTYFRPATIRYTKDEEKWNDFTREALKTTKRATFGNHAKMFIIDDAAFYVGSQNLYPGTELGEFGVLVDDSAKTKEVVKNMWKPLWENSYDEAEAYKACVERIQGEYTSKLRHPLACGLGR